MSVLTESIIVITSFKSLFVQVLTFLLLQKNLKEM
jgi:hypothetical protein